MPKATKGIESSLTYGKETAEMGTPAAEKLIEKMVMDTYPELKGGNMPGIRIEIKRVTGLNIKFKENEGSNVILAMETYLPAGDIARLYNLSKQGVPVRAVIESPQAEMDLRIEEVNTLTGEPWRKPEPVGAAKEPRD